MGTQDPPAFDRDGQGECTLYRENMERVEESRWGSWECEVIVCQGQRVPNQRTQGGGRASRLAALGNNFSRARDPRGTAI